MTVSSPAAGRDTAGPALPSQSAPEPRTPVGLVVVSQRETVGEEGKGVREGGSWKRGREGGRGRESE